MTASNPLKTFYNIYLFYIPNVAQIKKIYIYIHSMRL